MERSEPTYLDLDTPGEHIVCNSCGKDAVIVEVDEGFDHEFGFHSLWTNVCSECGERL
jgi:hypothetical protein